MLCGVVTRYAPCLCLVSRPLPDFISQPCEKLSVSPRLRDKIWKWSGNEDIMVVNPLTTDDECTCHATLAARYQLVQSILKIGFALAKKVG